MSENTSQTEIDIIDRYSDISNLQFLVQFMSAKRIGISDLSKAANVTKQAARHWFVADDIRLSVAEKIMSSFGYDLILDLSCRRDAEDMEDNTLAVDSILGIIGKGPVRRLTFLRIAFKRRGLNYLQVAEKAGMGKGTLDQIIKRDDIAMSKLMHLAQSIDMDLRITMRKKKDAAAQPRTPSRQIIEME